MTLTEIVEQTVQLLDGNIRVLDSHIYASFDDGWVSFGDADIVWRLVRERGAFSVVASPAFEETLWLDHDLLWRFVYGQPARMRSVEAEPSALANLIRSLQDRLRPVFQRESWPTIREQFVMIGRYRDAEMFGRPLPKGTLGGDP